MTTTARYSLASGTIQGTVNAAITDSNQIAGAAAEGIGLIVIPNGKNGGTGMIIGGAYVDFAPPAAPIPNIILQFIAAQINGGNVPASSFHPASLADMNTQLTIGGMATVAIPAQSTISPSLAQAIPAAP